MRNDVSSVSLLQQMINYRSINNTWTVEYAINVLASIELNKQDAKNIDAWAAQQAQKGCSKFIFDAIKNERLHFSDKETAENNGKLSFIQGVITGAGAMFAKSSGAVSVGVSGLRTAGALAGGSTLAPLLITGSLAYEAYKFFSTPKEQEDFLHKQLYPAEVIDYAKSHGRWIEDAYTENIRSYYKEMPAKLTTNKPTPQAESNKQTPKTKKPQEKRNNSGARALWDPRDDLLIVATTFMNTLLTYADCKCRHDKLAYIAHEFAKDENGNLIKSQAKERHGLLTAIIGVAHGLVPKERRFGETENGKYVYSSEACNCKIEDHRKIVVPRRKKA